MGQMPHLLYRGFKVPKRDHHSMGMMALFIAAGVKGKATTFI
jgi:hypothetical protein